MKVVVNKLPLKSFAGDFDKKREDFIKVLYVVAIISIIFHLTTDVVYGVKALLIMLFSVVTARETEIFFITMKSNVSRSEAKEATLTTKPQVTGMIYALLLPVGTPLFVVIAGSFISVFVGKMIFGGYSFNVFNPALVGRLFVSIAWPALVTVPFANILDNYLISLIFNRDLTAQVFSPLMELEANGIVSMNGMDSIPSLLFNPTAGYLFSIPAVVYLLVLIFFMVRKTVDLKPFVYVTLASVLVMVILILGFDLGLDYILFNYLSGALLFVMLFMMTDPFTKPLNRTGVIIYSVIFVFSFTLIRFLGKDPDGVLNALLFTNLFVPLLNKKTKKSELKRDFKGVISVLVMVAVLIGTALFINTILNQRIMSNEIVVGAYVKS